MNNASGGPAQRKPEPDKAKPEAGEPEPEIGDAPSSGPNLILLYSLIALAMVVAIGFALTIVLPFTIGDEAEKRFEGAGLRLTYAIPLLVLVATVLVFFGMGRAGYASFGVTQTVLRVVAALPLLFSGVFLHFFRLGVTASIIPPAFPARPLLVVLTGVLEIVGAIGLFVPRLRRPATLWISIMMVAIFPANIYGAGKVVDGLQFPSVPVRLAMQVVYIVLVLLAGYGIPKWVGATVRR